MTEQTVSSEISAAIDALRVEVGQLRDLFARRLMDDKARNGLYEALKEQTRATRDELKYRSLETLIQEALLAIDRLQSEPATPVLVDSATDELLDVFSRRNLRAVDDSGPFDPRVHEAIGSIPSSDHIPAGTIAAVHRTGYMLGDRLLRPARVTVAAAGHEHPKQIQDSDGQLA